MPWLLPRVLIPVIALLLGVAAARPPEVPPELSALPGLEACLALAGQVRVDLRLRADGSVERVDFRGDGGLSAGAASCLLDTLHGARFPERRRATWIRDIRLSPDPGRARAAAEPVGPDALARRLDAVLARLENAEGDPLAAVFTEVDAAPDAEIGVLLPGAAVALLRAQGVPLDACTEWMLGAMVAPNRLPVSLGRWAACVPSCRNVRELGARFDPLTGAERTRAVVAACDATNPDVVFGGTLAPFRPEMRWADYLAARGIVERLLVHLAREPSPRARAVQEAVGRRLPRLAWVLSLRRDTAVIADLERVAALAEGPPGGEVPLHMAVADALLTSMWAEGWGPPCAHRLREAHLHFGMFTPPEAVVRDFEAAWASCPAPGGGSGDADPDTRLLGLLWAEVQLRLADQPALLARYQRAWPAVRSSAAETARSRRGE